MRCQHPWSVFRSGAVLLSLCNVEVCSFSLRNLTRSLRFALRLAKRPPQTQSTTRVLGEPVRCIGPIGVEVEASRRPVVNGPHHLAMSTNADQEEIFGSVSLHAKAACDAPNQGWIRSSAIGAAVRNSLSPSCEASSSGLGARSGRRVCPAAQIRTSSSVCIRHSEATTLDLSSSRVVEDHIQEAHSLLWLAEV